MEEQEEGHWTTNGGARGGSLDYKWRSKRRVTGHRHTDTHTHTHTDTHTDTHLACEASSDPVSEPLSSLGLVGSSLAREEANR